MLQRVQFYAQDLAILRGLGHAVDVATRAHQLRPADVYFVWWWTWAFQPMALAALLRRPVVITGVFDEWAFDARPAPHRWLMRQALERADANIFVSELERAVICRRFAVRHPAHVPLTVDSTRYQPGRVPREPFLLTMGWLTKGNAERKGVPLVLQTMARLRERPDTTTIYQCRVERRLKASIAKPRGTATVSNPQIAIGVFHETEDGTRCQLWYSRRIKRRKANAVKSR